MKNERNRSNFKIDFQFHKIKKIQFRMPEPNIVNGTYLEDRRKGKL